MIRQGSIGKPELPRAVANQVHNPAAINGPETEMPHNDGYNRARFYSDEFRKNLNPAEMEVFPFSKRGARLRKCILAGTKADRELIRLKSVWSGGGQAHGLIRKRKFLRHG